MLLDTEQYSFQLILHSGNARSGAVEALRVVKEGDIEKGKQLLIEAKAELIEAQKLHAQMLRIMANQEETIVVNLLLIHAEDHITSSSIACEFTEELINVYQRLGELNG